MDLDDELLGNDSENDNKAKKASLSRFNFVLLISTLFIFIVGIILMPLNPFKLEGVQIQLQGDVTIIGNDEPIIFDTVISNLSPAISYDIITGNITITESGTYYINWWFSANGVSAPTMIDLAIVISTGKTITASSPILIGQISGNALFDVVASVGAPVTAQLVNMTGNGIFVGDTTVKADLTIMRVDQ